MVKPSGSNSLTKMPNSQPNLCAKSLGRNTRRNQPGASPRNRSAPRGVEMLMRSKVNFVKSWIGLLLVGALNLAAEDKRPERMLPVRGFCIAAPSGNRVDEFIKFIEEELAPRLVNVL